MRSCFVFICIAALTVFALAQKPDRPAAPQSNAGQPSGGSTDAALKGIFEAKIKAEWEALKNKDKRSYGELLADDYQGIEVDGRGERNKIQAINELADQNVVNYTLWGYKLIPLGADAALVIYESTMQFAHTAQIRYSR